MGQPRGAPLLGCHCSAGKVAACGAVPVHSGAAPGLEALWEKPRVTAPAMHPHVYLSLL